jgi:hypothetical protein
MPRSRALAPSVSLEIALPLGVALAVAWRFAAAVGRLVPRRVDAHAPAGRNTLGDMTLGTGGAMAVRRWQPA